MKELEWVGSSKKDVLKFPRKVKREIGYALHSVQNGETPDSVKLKN